MQLRKPAPVLLGAVAALSLFTGACATKKHVREAIAPVQTQVGELQKTTQQQQQSIGDLDRNVSRADEKATEADKHAQAAAQAAQQANQAASTAQQRADQANQSAQSAMNRAEAVAGQFNNLDNYNLISTEKVYFRLNRSDLSKDEKDKLDQAVQQLQNSKNYVIEVEGFTDRTGSKAANMELARRRAEAVVRYLTVEHNVPLRKIHDVGVGSDFPNADNKTRAARKENRRVDVKVYSLDITGQGARSSAAQQSPAPQQ